jgi:hypothetical protein
MENLIKRLENIGDELYRKFGTEYYTETFNEVVY